MINLRTRCVGAQPERRLVGSTERHFFSHQQHPRSAFSGSQMAMDRGEAIWDINYCEDTQLLPVTPFRYFANPHSSGAQEVPTPFSRLLDLPPEMLLLVFQFCDGPTLFQFMRTCRKFRYMTSKLFWSDSTILYQIHYEWWEARKFNLPVRLDMEFARQATQIEIFIRLKQEFAASYPESLPLYDVNCTEKVNFFWLAVQDSFPSARCIVLSDFRPFHEVTDYDDVQSLLTFILQQAPQDIRVFVTSTPGRHSKAYRALWTIDTSTNPQLQPAPTSRLPERVTAPLALLSEGPLRDFELMRGIRRLLRSEECGLMRLMRETRRRYRDRKPKPKLIYYAKILCV
jgi:hypothetical protein